MELTMYFIRQPQNNNKMEKKKTKYDSINNEKVMKYNKIERWIHWIIMGRKCLPQLKEVIDH